jgi:hypothetical protein
MLPPSIRPLTKSTTLLRLYCQHPVSDRLCQHPVSDRLYQHPVSDRLYHHPVSPPFTTCLPPPAGCLDAQVGWISEMAAHTKGLAPQQLVLSGTEGFFVPESGGNYYLLNPGGWDLGACVTILTHQLARL